MAHICIYTLQHLTRGLTLTCIHLLHICIRVIGEYLSDILLSICLTICLRMRDNLTANDADRRGTVPHKDEEFWFSDGPIVLAAHDVHFRVYREILAHHSAVFEDMLTFP